MNATNGELVNLIKPGETEEQGQLMKVIGTFDSDGTKYFALIPYFELPDGIAEVKVNVMITKLSDAETMDVVGDSEELEWAISEFSKILDDLEFSKG